MAPHENLFFVEKHYNDSLHKPQRAGTSHTDKEIQAAAHLLGRDSVAVEERHVKRTKKRLRDEARLDLIRSEGEAVGDGVVVLGAGSTANPGVAASAIVTAAHRDGIGGSIPDDGDAGEEGCFVTAFGKKKSSSSQKRSAWGGVVMRIDTAALKGGEGVEREGERGDRRAGLGHGRDRNAPLDVDSRWKTEARIAAGGTGGGAELASLRRAAKARGAMVHHFVTSHAVRTGFKFLFSSGLNVKIGHSKLCTLSKVPILISRGIPY